MDHMIIKNGDINYHHTCANVKCNETGEHIMTYHSQIDAWEDGWFLTYDQFEANYGEMLFNNELWVCPKCAKCYF